MDLINLSFSDLRRTQDFARAYLFPSFLVNGRTESLLIFFRCSSIFMKFWVI